MAVNFWVTEMILTDSLMLNTVIDILDSLLKSKVFC